MMTLHERIRHRRKQLGITQGRVAQVTGLTTEAISAIELGKRTPNFTSATKIAQVLKCSLDWLATGQHPYQKPLAVSQIMSTLETSIRDLEATLTRARYALEVMGREKADG